MKTLLNFLNNVIIWATCFLMTGHIGNAQTQGGLILDKDAYQSVPLANSSSEKGASLPDCVDLTAYAPYAHSQGNTNSCVGWAIANAYTIHNAVKTGERRRALIDSRLRYSASFIYNQIKVSCEKGARLVDGLEFITRKGTCLDVTFPSYKPCNEKPNEGAFVEASQYRLTSPYRRVFQKQKDKTVNTQRQLANHNPVIVGFPVCPDMRKYRGQKFWHPQNDHMGQKGHAMVVVGYDNEGFILLNSFGKNWGQQGFITIPYSAYEAYATESFVLDYGTSKNMDDANKPGNDNTYKLMSGVKMQQAVYNSDDGLSFVEMEPAFSQKTAQYQYSLLSTDTSDNMIRLELLLAKGMYAYVFNMDSRQRVRKMGAFDGYGQDTIQFLPSAKQAYIAPSSGNECIGILFSYTELDDFETRLNKLQHQSHEHILSILGQEFDLIAPELLKYHEGQAFVEATTKMGDGSVLPLILEISIE